MKVLISQGSLSASGNTALMAEEHTKIHYGQAIEE